MKIWSYIDKKYIVVEMRLFGVMRATVFFRNKKASLKEALIILAESQGFEPWVGINLRWFSRPVHSAALSTLQDAK